MILSIILLIIGLVLLTKGADFFVQGASSLAVKFNIPPIIIGLTIVAIGTSAPEAAVSINSALKGLNGVAVGNVIGSNIANVFLILGVTSAVCALNIKKNTVKYEIPFVFVITVLLTLMGFFFGRIGRLCAFVLLIFFLLFLSYLFKISKENNENLQETQNLSLLKIIVFIFGGLTALVYGSDLTVNSAINIARILNISERIIGLTIIAIGTSLPELVTCVIAALKKQADIAVGNIIGSNIFNILFVLGITSAINPVKFQKEFLFDACIAIFAVVLLFFYTCKKKILTRWQGFSFAMLYVIYIVYLIIK